MFSKAQQDAPYHYDALVLVLTVNWIDWSCSLMSRVMYMHRVYTQMYLHDDLIIKRQLGRETRRRETNSQARRKHMVHNEGRYRKDVAFIRFKGYRMPRLNSSPFHAINLRWPLTWWNYNISFVWKVYHCISTNINIHIKVSVFELIILG